MARKQASSVAKFMAERGTNHRHVGGRGRLGPLCLWLLREADAIAEARATSQASTITWAEIAKLAADDGVVPAPGAQYQAVDVRSAWSRLLRHDKLPRRVKILLGETPPTLVQTPPSVRFVEANGRTMEDGNATEVVGANGAGHVRSNEHKQEGARADSYAESFAKRRPRKLTNDFGSFELDATVGYRPKEPEHE